jgi:hypothetical protein
MAGEVYRCSSCGYDTSNPNDLNRHLLCTLCRPAPTLEPETLEAIPVNPQFLLGEAVEEKRYRVWVSIGSEKFPVVVEFDSERTARLQLPRTTKVVALGPWAQRATGEARAKDAVRGYLMEVAKAVTEDAIATMAQGAKGELW